jgi:hypothetical protein
MKVWILEIKSVNQHSEYKIYSTDVAAFKNACSFVLEIMFIMGFGCVESDQYPFYMRMEELISEGSIISLNQVIDLYTTYFFNTDLINVDVRLFSRDILDENNQSINDILSKEFSCSLCGRKNDNDVKECWCCGVKFKSITHD